MLEFSSIILWIGYFMVLYLVMFWLQIFLTRKKEKETEKITRYPFVSIAIPAYNEEKNIRETIESVLKLDYPREKMEILVVDDGSRDKTSEIVRRIIKENPERNISLCVKENGGKASALNKALSILKGEFFVSFDADSIIDSDALQKILPEFEKDNEKKVAAVLPFMKVYKPETVYQKMQWFEYMINFFYKKLMSDINCVNVTPGPFSVYRKEIIERIGGFDEKNLTEDLEIALKIQKNHYKIIQLLTTDVYTKSPRNLRELYKQRNRWYKGTILNAFKYRSMFLNREYGDFGFIQMPRLLLEWVVIIGIALALAYVNLVKPGEKIIRGISLTGINFSLAPIIEKISQFSLLDLNITTVFFMAISIFFPILLLVCAHREVKENLIKHNPIHLAGYILLYSMFVCITFIGVSLDLMFRKSQKW
jgi:cellulose synthase/poly-beta-1,6-N-acetylglucosamine synthase-like glycosyltransferase